MRSSCRDWPSGQSQRRHHGVAARRAHGPAVARPRDDVADRPSIRSRTGSREETLPVPSTMTILECNSCGKRPRPRTRIVPGIRFSSLRRAAKNRRSGRVVSSSSVAFNRMRTSTGARGDRRKRSPRRAPFQYPAMLHEARECRPWDTRRNRHRRRAVSSTPSAARRRDRIEHSIVRVGVVDQPLGRLIRDGRTREIRDRKSRGLCRRE